MSFRTRLTSFFVLIVVVPMIAIGVMVFRLISDSSQGKTEARAAGLASAATSIYLHQSVSARAAAATLAKRLGGAPGAGLVPALSAVAAQAGLARVIVSSGGRTLADVGDRNAIAPGSARLQGTRGQSELTVTVSTLSALEYVHELTAVRDVAVIVRQGGRTLGSSLAARHLPPLPPHGTVSVSGRTYGGTTVALRGFGRARVRVTVLADRAVAASSLGASRVIAAVFLAAFALLALAFSTLASRALHGQVTRFLEAAKRLGGGDFSSPVPIDGHDEFAELGQEFNRMSTQLEQRLRDLTQERARLRDAITRIGHTFASNLDRQALLELALRTAVDGVGADGGRISVRDEAEAPLAEAVREGNIDGVEQQVLETERHALGGGEQAEAFGEAAVVSIALGRIGVGERLRGLMTVVRRDGRFDAEDRGLLRFLATQATLALENVELHFQVRRQAVTDELTGLANHGRFQDRLSAEIEQVRRYQHPVGLIMVDIDNFKGVNDTHGHQQGDLVLKQVARVLRENSRDADTAARYGGEEMALILPHTDVDGAYAIAERVRQTIERLSVPRLDGQGMLRVTASLGVAASADGNKDSLIADADSALYRAKRTGKNRSVAAAAATASVL